jgi:FkbM family methyltransferase
VAFSVIDMFRSKLPMIEIVDVGAMVLDGDPPGYMPLVNAGVARVVGFEPNQPECDKFNATQKKNSRCLPYFVGSGQPGTFHLNSAPMTSSLYPSNMRLLSKFNMLAELTTTVSTSPCQTRRLDDISELTRVDVLKVDVQGAELDVIKGGEQRLKDATVVVTEVEFVEMYQGQPLFADVDRELRRQGFCLHFLGQSLGPAFRPFVPAGNPGRGIRQALWADACYVKDFMRFGELTPEQLLKLVVVLHDLFGSVDLAAVALQHYDAKTGEGFWKPYVEKLLMGSAPPPPPLTR